MSNDKIRVFCIFEITRNLKLRLTRVFLHISIYLDLQVIYYMLSLAFVRTIYFVSLSKYNYIWCADFYNFLELAYTLTHGFTFFKFQTKTYIVNCVP